VGFLPFFFFFFFFKSSTWPNLQGSIPILSIFLLSTKT
jgi:hypothetical protein